MWDFYDLDHKSTQSYFLEQLKSEKASASSMLLHNMPGSLHKEYIQNNGKKIWHTLSKGSSWTILSVRLKKHLIVANYPEIHVYLVVGAGQAMQ